MQEEYTNPSDPSASSETGPASVPALSNIYPTFWDFLMEPIAGLKYAITAGDLQVSGVTDAEGRATPLLGAHIGDDIQIYVKREHDGSYKYIGATIAPEGDYPLAIVSPKIVTDIETEPHEGAAGALTAPPITAKAAQEKAPATRQMDRSLETGRNAKGHPVAVSKYCPDWLERKLPAICNMWTREDFQTPPVATKKKPKDSAKSSTPAPTRADSRVYRNGEWGVDILFNWLYGKKPEAIQNLGTAESDKLRALIAFTEKQVLIDYGFKDKTKKVTSAEVIAKYAKEPRKQPEDLFPKTKSNDSIHRCLAYVKIALWRCGYVAGVTGTENAKDSGKDWESFGFKNISSSLPQVEIAYGSGDKVTKHKQPDVSYTAPGDIVVYEEVGTNRAGHIDIRTYHGFVSDFQWQNYPGIRKYRVTGVYRKFSDTMALVRVKAFLRIIREFETQGYSDADSYFALPDGKDGATGRPLKRKFNSTNTHPFSDDSPSKYETKDYFGNKNTAAGAYQIKLRTWEEVVNQTGWPQGFTPEMQERIAIYRLQQRPMPSMPHPRRSALGYIMAADIESAVTQTGLHDEWSWLPGGKKPKISMDELKAKFLANITREN